MTDATSTSAPPLDLARSTPGEYLRRLREEKGHTHAAVGSALHLTVHYIKALESDEYGKLPGLTFVKGYLRSYARFLGADVDNVLARFDEHITGLLDAGMHTARVERSRRRQDQALRWAIGAGLVVVVGLAAGWWFMRDAEAPAAATAQRSAPAPTEVAAIAPPPVAAAATATVANAGGSPPAQAAQGTGYAPTPQANAAMASAPNQFSNPTVMAGLIGLEASVAAPNAATAGFADSAAVAALPGPVATGFVPAPAATQTASVATPTPAPATSPATAPSASGARQVTLIGAGNDELKVSFNGNSWIEVDDGNMVRLYNDMLAAGDTLTIRGVAPFRVLLGDAASVAVSLNAAPIDFSADIRTDNTARLVLGASVAAQAPAAPAAGQAATMASPAPQPATAASPAPQPASTEVTP